MISRGRDILVDMNGEATKNSGWFIIELKRSYVILIIGTDNEFLLFLMQLVANGSVISFFIWEVTISDTLNIGISVDALKDVSDWGKSENSLISLTDIRFLSMILEWSRI